MLKFKVAAEDGGCLWTMEIANRRWLAADLPQDSIKAGDEMIVIGWPARDSSPEMIFGGFEIKGQPRIVFQTSATGNSNPPTSSVVITRPVCED